MISLIVAFSKNHVIGNNGCIPWKIRGEQKRFKELTTGNIVIMGRRSFEEIGQPLPNRETIVISKTVKLEEANLTTVGSLDEALSLAKGKEIYISGGERLYREAISLVDRMYITVIDKEFKGDTFFPEINTEVFTKVFEERHEEEIPYTYMTYQRNTVNIEKFLIEDKYVDFSAPIIMEKSRDLFYGIESEVEKVKIAYEYVRDEIDHSFDIDSTVIVAKASEVLKYKNGICHAKANLLTALLRLQGIPVGFCFQHITLGEDDLLGYCVHCFNAIYIDSHWIKVDARGNTKGKNANFSLGEPVLAFENRSEYDEYFWNGIYARPHLDTMNILEISETIQDVLDNIPDYINEIPDIL